ncbi:MAG: hypothetical protein WA004_07925 [Saprospiraceae bacterium]
MDIGTIIIAVVFLAAFTLPFYFFGRNKKSGSKGLTQAFSQAAAKAGLNIAGPECWNNMYCIGLDPQAGKILYLKVKNGAAQETVIDLAEIEKCRVANHTKSGVAHNQATKVVDKIELVFTPFAAHHNEKTLEFYSLAESLTIGNELKLAEKWKQLVEQQLKKAVAR